MANPERTPDLRPYDTWRICGQPVDPAKPHAGCSCTGWAPPRRRILTDDQTQEDAA